MAETAITEVPRVRLDGRHALVTGASSGLGRHFAEVLARAGARVSLAARRVKSLAIAVDAIAAAGGSCRAVPLDVTDEAGVKVAFDQAEAWGGPVQILINNAGVATTRTALELAEEDWDTTLDTNLKGAWLVAREAGRRLVAHRAPGTIVNVASILGLRVAGSVAASATSKAGLLQLTKALALEGARHGIRVNAIAPGLHRDRPEPRVFRERARSGDREADPAAPPWAAKRSRWRSPSARHRRVALHHGGA